MSVFHTFQIQWSVDNGAEGQISEQLLLLGPGCSHLVLVREVPSSVLNIEIMLSTL